MASFIGLRVSINDIVYIINGYPFTTKDNNRNYTIQFNQQDDTFVYDMSYCVTAIEYLKNQLLTELIKLNRYSKLILDMKDDNIVVIMTTNGKNDTFNLDKMDKDIEIKNSYSSSNNSVDNDIIANAKHVIRALVFSIVSQNVLLYRTDLLRTSPYSNMITVQKIRENVVYNFLMKELLYKNTSSDELSNFKELIRFRSFINK